MKVNGSGDGGQCSCERHGGWVGGLSVAQILYEAVVNIVSGMTAYL